jgi:hypothetical protein
MIAQRLTRSKRFREREQVTSYMGGEQDMRRKMVKQAARNAEIIDLTGDATARESKFRRYVGVENVENCPPGIIAQSGRI